MCSPARASSTVRRRRSWPLLDEDYLCSERTMYRMRRREHPSWSAPSARPALAGRLIEETCHKQGVQPQVLTLHSDRGAPMTSKCTAQLLADLGVTRLSRPQVSDDNPFSEAQFKTLKYHPGFPGRFHEPRSPSAERSSLGTTPNIDGGIAMRTTSIPNPERAGADPSRDPSSRTLRSRDPTTGSPSPSRLDPYL